MSSKSPIDQLNPRDSEQANGDQKFGEIRNTTIERDTIDPIVSKQEATAVAIQTRAGDAKEDTSVEEAEEKEYQGETTEEEAKTSLSVRGIERLQRTVLEDLHISSKMLHDFNEFSREKIGDAKKVSVKYCKRIRKIRELLYKTFEKIRILKDKIKKMDS
mmetsp:Transcript_21585/g.34834  ORF Transcript_21585/g.34834 Transcript_21585/m.34834 type:complete len:160 (-) Transcript_21585:286-765(-)